MGFILGRDEVMNQIIKFENETMNNVTIEDCLELFIRKGYQAIIEDGHVVQFEREQKNLHFSIRSKFDLS